MKDSTKAKIASFFIPNIVYVLLVALVVRLTLSLFGTLTLDQGTFIAWSRTLVSQGFKTFYNSWSDYLPGYLYVLWFLGHINTFIPQVLLYKLPAIFSDLLTGLVIFKILLKSKGEKWALIGASIYLFNPAILGNSTLWGQADSLTALFSLFAVYQFPFSIFLSAVSLSIGTLIKPQAAFIFPVILFLFVREKKKFAHFAIYIFTGLSIFVAGFVPFWNHGNLISFILERLSVSGNQYPYTSINAFNFWGLNGFWKPDNIYFQVGGYVFTALLTIFLIYKLRKNKNAEYYLMSFIFAASFIFFTRIHERHLLPVFAPLTIVAIENPIFLIPYIGFSLSYVANLYYSYIWITQNFKEAIPDLFVKIFEALNVSFVIFIFYALLTNLKIKWQEIINYWKNFSVKPIKKTFEFPKITITRNQAKYILAGILLFAFVARVFDLSSPKAMYFDEVYHAFTAKTILSSDVAKAWEWWNTPPEGFAYEWTHPPLAKLGMVLGMKVFGQNSFGWRIPGALLGVGAVLIIYLLGKTLFHDELVGLLSAAVFSLDGLPLVLSRIGMNDSYILFFSLLSIYLFIKQKDFLSALAFGLAIASKWSAIWAIPIMFVLWIWRKKKFTKSIVWFFVLPAAIYLLSYFDMFLTGHNLTTWWGMQEQMWWYHTGLRATHPYSSPWWSWPFLIRPIYLYTSDEVGGWVSRIYAMGNPLIFWFGLASVAISLVYSYVERNKKLGLVVFSYLIFFVPWALSPRIMFLYHYLPSIPFLTIATGYVLRRNPKLIFTFLFASLLVFIYFYPHWAGLSVPLWFDKSYYWVSSWR